jgi:hypothetical protein
LSPLVKDAVTEGVGRADFDVDAADVREAAALYAADDDRVPTLDNEADTDALALTLAELDGVAASWVVAETDSVGLMLGRAVTELDAARVAG